MSQIKHYLSLEHRRLFYNAYVKAHLITVALSGEILQTVINKINKLQRRACKLILGGEYTSLEEARNRLKILSFDESVFSQNAKTMYKIANNITIDLFQIRNTNANDTICIQQKLITKTYLYNFDPLKPHFYIVKLGFTGVYIISKT